jgi:hypothetical protein
LVCDLFADITAGNPQKNQDNQSISGHFFAFRLGFVFVLPASLVLVPASVPAEVARRGHLTGQSQVTPAAAGAGEPVMQRGLL